MNEHLSTHEVTLINQLFTLASVYLIACMHTCTYIVLTFRCDYLSYFL